MHYACSRCHEHFESDVTPKECPKCKAEAGLEPLGGKIPFPMAVFGIIVALSLGASVVSAVVFLP